MSILKHLTLDEDVVGRVNLIYIDPPFGTGQEFVGYDTENAYDDRLTDSAYFEFMRERLIFLHKLLADDGCLYLHVDTKVGHYLKIILDEIFGEGCFRNDITRIKCNPKNFKRKAFGNVKDGIYFYSKSPNGTNDQMYWSDYRAELSVEEQERQFSKIDTNGRRYATTPLHAKGETKNGPTGQPWRGLLPPKGRHWRYAPSVLEELDVQGLIEWSSTGNPRKIIYADENSGKKIQDVWDFRDPGFERSAYPTEKNIDLLKRVISSSSRPGDLVLDCFAGSGTTLVAAQELGRRWIGIDRGSAAIKVIEQRLQTLRERSTVSYQLYEAA